jgi:hypothetical protein
MLCGVSQGARVIHFPCLAELRFAELRSIMEGRAMRLPRMTTRKWILTVAISGAVLGLIVQIHRELRLSSRYRVKARMHHMQAERYEGTVFQVPVRRQKRMLTRPPIQR